MVDELLQLGESKDLPAALAAKPAERVKRDGVEYFVYRCVITIPRGPAKLEATPPGGGLQGTQGSKKPPGF